MTRITRYVIASVEIIHCGGGYGGQVASSSIPTLAEALRRRMGALGANQNEAAAAMGVLPARVSQWVNGRRPDGAFYLRIMDFLDVDLFVFGVMLTQTDLLTAKGRRDRQTDEELEMLIDVVEGRLDADGWQMMPGPALRQMLRHERGAPTVE